VPIFLSCLGRQERAVCLPRLRMALLRSSAWRWSQSSQQPGMSPEQVLTTSMPVICTNLAMHAQVPDMYWQAINQQPAEAVLIAFTKHRCLQHACPGPDLGHTCRCSHLHSLCNFNAEDVCDKV